VGERAGVKVSTDKPLILITLILAFSLEGRRDRTFATPSCGRRERTFATSSLREKGPVRMRFHLP